MLVLRSPPSANSSKLFSPSSQSDMLLSCDWYAGPSATCLRAHHPSNQALQSNSSGCHEWGLLDTRAHTFRCIRHATSSGRLPEAAEALDQLRSLVATAARLPTIFATPFSYCERREACEKMRCHDLPREPLQASNAGRYCG